MIAFGFEEFFEGMAFGLLKEKAVVVQLSIGIIIHSGCAAVSMGAGFAKAGFNILQIIIFIILFSLASPIGIIIGLSVGGGDSTVVRFIFLSLSAGTFIYVASTEIIPHEF